MGCNLKDLSNPEDITMEELAGQRVGIDAFLLAFQFLTTIRDLSATGDGMPLRNRHGKTVSHLMGFLSRASALVEKGVKPVFIFDGEHPELKDDTIAERKTRSQEAREIWEQALEDGDTKLAQKMAQRCIRYTPEMVEESIEMLRLMGIPALRAKAEGEAQAAVMAANGQLDVVATQDWDALLYGSPVMVRNLTSAGSKRYGRIIRAQRIELQQLLAENDLSREQLVDLGIMIGTDFHPGIKGIGPKTGLKLIKEFGTIEEVCAAKDKEVPERLDLIRMVFLDHPVNDFSEEELQLGEVDIVGLKRFLIEERDFSPGRVDKALEAMQGSKPVRDSEQTSLFSF
jgi:flap endonuclease-1